MKPVFSNRKWRVQCWTVGDVMAELRCLPPGLPVNQGFSKSVELVVFNRNDPDSHLSFEEGGEQTLSRVTDQSAPAAGDGGKPSWKDAPEWAQWLAQDVGGEWYWFLMKPVPKGDRWVPFYPGKGRREIVINPNPVPNPNWRDTLEQRPASPAEEEA